MNKEPAFPGATYDGPFAGMFLRDYFAAKVMQALLTRETKLNGDTMLYPDAAYDMADAMLEARKQK